MTYIDYKRLQEIEQKIPPLRGTNKYPYFTGERTSVKHFKPDVLDGEKVYRVFYSYFWGSEELEKEDYKKLPTAEQENWHYLAWADKYCKYTREEAEIGIVRPDNTFEFTSTRLHQGDRNILSTLIGRNIFSDVRLGGVVLKNGIYYNPSDLFMPIFKGQRIDLETRKSVVNYEVHIPRVDRKKSKQLVSKYETQMKFVDAMFKSMNVDTFREESNEALKNIAYTGNRSWLYGDFREAIENRINEVINKDFLEASLLLIVYYRIGNIWNLLNDNVHTIDNSIPYNYYLQAKRHFTNKLKQTNDVFYDEVFKCNEKYPRSVWGVKVYMNDERVVQY